MEINPKVIDAAVAGLLHDIGKLEQRARVDPWNPAPGLEGEGQPVHATWSLYFAQNYVYDKFRPAALAGAYHHAPDKSPASDKELSWIISLADKLSAGERADQLEGEGQPPVQMVSIFDRISKDNQEKSDGWHYLPLKPLSLNEGVIFPGERLSKDEAGLAYDGLNEIVRSAARQPIDKGLVYLENLQGAMQQATWSVPSAYYHSIPDVSLYDHSRMTAALAVCLLDFDKQEIMGMLAAVRRDFINQSQDGDDSLMGKSVALLVGGDISGVQDFIYTISSKGAARTLRGRSFYLQMLTEAALRFVLQELGLPYSNVIYSGGGHFFLLAPVSASAKLDAIRAQISRTLLEFHGTSLYLAIGSAVVPVDGFRIGRFPDYWNEMHQDLTYAKGRRYTELGDQFYELIFKPPEIGGNPENTCSVCGEDSRPVNTWDIEREEQNQICTLCKSFMDELGQKLPEAKYVALGFQEPDLKGAQTASSVLSALGMKFQFVPDGASSVHLPGVDRVTLWAVDDPKDDQWPEIESKPAAHMIRYTVNHTPDKSFDQLQEEVAGGFKRLGVLRMDVDDLGKIFQHGLGKYATLARLSTLSFQISLFFEGWIKYLCEQNPYRVLIYPVYAGGDDIFLIGPWDRMPALVQLIRDDFTAYTAGNPALHLSAGLTFITGKYPVYQAAEDAAEALEEAKSRDGKNAFCFIGQVWDWDTFNQVSSKQVTIRRLVAGGKLDLQGLEGPQAIIQSLRQLAEDEARRFRSQKTRPVWGPWMWQGAYTLTRMAERYKSTQSELAQAILSIRDELDANNYQEINQWGFAARWTQLEIRK